MPLSSLSVVVPVGPGEHAWVDLVNDLALLPAGTEIVFSTLRQYGGFRHAPALAKLQHQKVKWVFAHPGRAQLLNEGAKAANGEYLWFLHADTRFMPETVDALKRLLVKHPHALFYCNLDFNRSEGKFLWNAVGNWVRSHIFKLPKGQQGFCVRTKDYIRLGGFTERITPGEDIAFVLRAQELGIPIRCTGGTVTTRTRYYQQHGWFKTTVWHQYVWMYHAFPRWWMRLKKRLYLA